MTCYNRSARTASPAPEGRTGWFDVLLMEMGTEDASLATVLFADDDPDIRELGRLLLVKHGHEVVTAADGRAAIEMLLSCSPDLVITDVNMPEEDGLAVCAAVRSSPALREIPLVLLTALPANDERVVRASTTTNAVVLIKTDISRLGDLADQLVGSCGDEAA